VDARERLTKLTKAVRRDLLRVLTAEPDVRADAIRQFRERGDDVVVELLADLEADEALRTQVVDVLRESLEND
jgi:HEAT repeat protein